MTDEQFACLMTFHNNRSPVVLKALEDYFLNEISVKDLSINYGLSVRSLYQWIKPIKNYHQFLHNRDITRIDNDLLLTIIAMARITSCKLNQVQIDRILENLQSTNDIVVKSYYGNKILIDAKKIRFIHKILLKVEW